MVPGDSELPVCSGRQRLIGDDWPTIDRIDRTIRKQTAVSGSGSVFLQPHRENWLIKELLNVLHYDKDADIFYLFIKFHRNAVIIEKDSS